MFNLEDYYDIKINKGIFENEVYNISVKIILNSSKIESDINELRETLIRIRKILGKNYAFIVTKDKVKLMEEN